MTMGDRPSTADRVRFFLAENLAVAVGACLLLAVLGGFVAADEFTGPETTTEQRTAATWTTDGEFEHAAVVRNGTTAFAEGDVLRNRSLYFGRVTPVLNGSYAFTHRGDAGSASVTTDLRLVVRAVDREGEDVLWNVSEPLAEASDDVASGEQFRIPFEVNVTAQTELADRVRAELGTSRGTVQILIAAETDVTADLDGERVVDERSARLTIRPEGNDYTVSTSAAGERSRTTSETVEVPVESDPVRGGGAVGAALLGVVGAGALVRLDRDGKLAVPASVEREIRHRRERDSFDEWISAGDVPRPDGERVIALDSLEDLVDVAIDSDRRVIEDDATGEYVVVDEERRYVYSRRPETVALGNETTDDDPVERENGGDAPSIEIGDSTDGDRKSPDSDGKSPDGDE